MAVEAQTPTDVEFARMEAEVNAENNKRTGVGPRLKAGRTRGKGSIVIKFEQFDESKPETIPTSISQFTEVIGTKEEKTLLDYLVRGYNDASYEAASDPLAEFVDASWPPEAQTQFRIVVRNYSRGANVSLDDAVNLIKPGFVAQFSKK